MDTRRRDQREDRTKPELGTETVPVELIDLQVVGASRPSGGRKAMIALAVLGIVAFGTVLATGKLPAPTPKPTVPVVSLASALPTALLATPTLVPRTFRPPTIAPTPVPTPAPPWQWTSTAFLPELHPSVEGMWAVGDTAMALISQYDVPADRAAWSIARFGGEGEWELYPTPQAIDRFFAGTVIDGRLWLLARVAGITEDDAVWQIISTGDGQTWESLGDIDGLPPFNYATVLTRTHGTWVIVTGYGSGEGASDAAVSWSPDGRHWELADVPELRSNVGYRQAASIGEATVLTGYDFDTPDQIGTFVLRSTDGRSWRRSGFEAPTGRVPQDLACDDQICVITLAPPYELQASTGQTLMLSTDGDEWIAADVDVPYTSPDSTIGRLATIPTGFIALSGNPARALLSSDGSEWRAVDVLPPGAGSYISLLVVAGDTIVGFEPSQGSGAEDRIWWGSLAAMGT